MVAEVIARPTGRPPWRFQGWTDRGTQQAPRRRVELGWRYLQGDTYNEIGHQIASALDHCVQRVDPKPGEHVWDLATERDGTSRLVARPALSSPR
jgi:hypothetical protein